MTTVSLPAQRTGPRKFLVETWLLVERSLRVMPRVPERLLDVTLQPIVFTILFLYVFGSAIKIPGMSYQDYLLPGLIGQQLAFGIIGAGVATANDFSSGVVDRFRSLPIRRLAVVASQVAGQVLEQVLGLSIVVAVGLALGWRPDLGLGGFLELIGLALLGMIAFTSFGVLLGMLLRNSDAVQGLGFSIVFPLSFLAGTFVPIEGMKLVPRVIGEWDPIAAFVAAIRKVSQGTEAHGSWMLEHPVTSMVGWSALLLVVCVPLTVRKFQRL